MIVLALLYMAPYFATYDEHDGPSADRIVVSEYCGRAPFGVSAPDFPHRSFGEFARGGLRASMRSVLEALERGDGNTARLIAANALK